MPFREAIDLSAAYEKHNLNHVTFFQWSPGILLARNKPLIIDHHLDRHIQFTGLVQQYLTRRLAVPVHNVGDKVCHCAAGYFQLGLSAN